MVDDAENAFDGFGSLIRLAGASIPARGRFVGETLLNATYSSLTFGLVCGQLGAISPCGPLVPFLVGSWVGYGFGLVGYWRSMTELTTRYAKKYPDIVSHALSPNAPLRDRIRQDENQVPLHDFIEQGALGRLTWYVFAAHSCRPQVEEMERQQRQQLVDRHLEEQPDDTAEDRQEDYSSYN